MLCDPQVNKKSSRKVQKHKFHVLFIVYFRCYVIDCKTNTPNIPYADSFYTQTRYCITWAGPEQTRISICLGITWLKSPFVKSIIKSAAYKAFDDTCADYMACLRQEIAARIGATAIVGESSANQPDEKDLITAENDSGEEKSFDSQGKENSPRNSWIAWAIGTISENKISILVLLFTFILGALLGKYRSVSRSGHLSSNYDLELEVLRELNMSKIPLSSSRTSWESKKFQRSYSQLAQLHEDFATVRKMIWLTLQKVNDLERRVYKAEMAALLGDRLLACYKQNDSPDCSVLQEQWKSLLQDKQKHEHFI